MPAGRTSPLDLLKLIESQYVRLRLTGDELVARSRGLRLCSRTLVAKMRATGDFIAVALREIGLLMSERAPGQGHADPELPEEILRTAGEVREAAQRLMERGRELARQANLLVRESRAAMAVFERTGRLPSPPEG